MSESDNEPRPVGPASRNAVAGLVHLAPWAVIFWTVVVLLVMFAW